MPGRSHSGRAFSHLRLSDLTIEPFNGSTCIAEPFFRAPDPHFAKPRRPELRALSGNLPLSPQNRPTSSSTLFSRSAPPLDSPYSSPFHCTNSPSHLTFPQ